MPTLTERVQVLFSSAHLARLQALADAEGISVGAIIRRAVDRTYLNPDLADRLAAVEQLASMTMPVGDWDQMEREATDRFGPVTLSISP